MWTEVTCDVLDAGFVGPRPQLRLRREIRYKRGEHLQSNHKHKSMSLASSPSPPHRHPRFSPRVEAASVLRIAGDNRTDNTTEEGTRSVALGPNRHRQRRRSVSPRWLDSR